MIFPQDYKIEIGFTDQGHTYWKMLCKGIQKRPEKDELDLMVNALRRTAKTLTAIKNKK